MSFSRGGAGAGFLLAVGIGVVFPAASMGEVLYRERFESSAAGVAPAGWSEITLDGSLLPQPSLHTVEQDGNRSFGRLAEGRQRLAERLDLSRVPVLAWDAARALDLRRAATVRGRIHPGGAAGGGPAIVSADGELLLAFSLEASRVTLTGVAGQRESILGWDATRRWIEFEIATGESPSDEIRVRFWPEEGERPVLPQLRIEGDAVDLEAIHPGVIARGGSMLIDDLEIRREGEDPGADEEPPQITILERGAPLADGSLWGRSVHPEIVIDDDSPVEMTVILDGAELVEGSEVSGEGDHTLRVDAEDAHRNRASLTVRFSIDLSPPTLSLLEPPSGACISALTIALAGTVGDPHLAGVSVGTDAEEVEGSIEEGRWAATLTAPPEGTFNVAVTARDLLGHSTRLERALIVDRTPPAIEILSSGFPAIDGLLTNETPAFVVTLTDSDPNASLDVRLDGVPYESGTPVAAEGDHRLTAVAIDCAGNRAERAIRFTIDRTAPAFGPLTPRSGTTVGDLPTSLRGTVSLDTESVTVVGTSIASAPVDGIFIITVPFVEGSNRFELRAVDRAGNRTDLEYLLTVNTAAPSLEIFESGAPLPDGAFFNREVRPEIRSDDPGATILATVDGEPFTSGTVLSLERAYVLRATATNALGHSASAEVGFAIDRTPPAFLSLTPRSESVSGSVPDALRGTVSLDSVSVAAVGTQVADVPEEGEFVLEGLSFVTGANHFLLRAIDRAGNVGELDYRLTIDTAAPLLEILEGGIPLRDGALFDRDVRPEIRSDDPEAAIEAIVNGEPFVSGSLLSLEGEYSIEATATSSAGNVATAAASFAIDRSPPALEVVEPAGSICTSASSLILRGTMNDPHPAGVEITGIGPAVPAGLDPATGAWSAAVPLPHQGVFSAVVTASDALGQSNVAIRPVRVDRTPPTIEILADGAAGRENFITRGEPAFTVSARDDDPDVLATVLLDGSAYVAGSAVAGEGTHLLSVTATDCAGNRADRSLSFTIDRTAPLFLSLIPGPGTMTGTIPAAIRGVVSSDAISVSAAGLASVAVLAAGEFALSGMTFVEGDNRFLLRATDSAGNIGETEYRFTLSTRAPSVEILEAGAPLADGAVFNREVLPEFRSSDPEADLVVTRNGSPFAPGSAIPTEGDHRLVAMATDALGHKGSAEVSFTIDRTPPVVVIEEPEPGFVSSGIAEVSGTAGDAVSVGVNGVTATLAGGIFRASVPIEHGENRIVATGRDAAGNVGRDELTVALDLAAAGILLTEPPDGSLMNRTSIRVAGRVLSPDLVEEVEIGDTRVPVDAAGGFFVESFPLQEGENRITATALAGGGPAGSASATVVRDTTAPRVRLLESGDPLQPEARFAVRAALSVDVSDDRAIESSEVRVDGSVVELPVTISEPGAHTVVVVAADAASNETRVERTFFVGSAGAGCRLEGFVPASGSIVGSSQSGLTGRTGGAAGVKVNGVPATVAEGSFCASVELPLEGPNEVRIVCTDADGNETGAPAFVTLIRSTGLPAVTIDLPAEGAVTAGAETRVEGFAGAGVVEVTINGVEASIAPGDPDAPRRFVVEAARLVPGLNVLLAKGRTASMRQALASRRVIRLEGDPSIVLTVPADGATIGGAAVSISGSWRHLDPETLAVAGSAASAEVERAGDLEGTFLFRDVALASEANEIRVTGSDELGRVAVATIALARDDTAPRISIEQPRDRAIFGADAGATFEVEGSAVAAPGASIDVAGHPATIRSAESLSPTRTAYTFDASVSFATSGATPVVARVTEPGGASAARAIAVTRLEAPPEVERVFPENLAIEVDPGAMIVVLFSAPMDRSSVASAFRLETAGGLSVAGILRMDRDALTFAPSAPLGEGEQTIRIAATAMDVGGATLGSAHVSTFRVAGAPVDAPQLDAFPASVCGETLAVSGSAPPNARLRLEIGDLALTTSADSAGRFRFEAPLTGPSGYQLIRVRILGSGGTLSPAAHACVLTTCGGLRVVSATYDRDVNTLTIDFTAPVDASTTGAIVLRIGEETIDASVSVDSNRITVAPLLDLHERSLTLEISTALRSTDGHPLSAPFSQDFLFLDEEVPPGDGTGFISGEVYDAATGRPLAGARVVVPLTPEESPLGDSERAPARTGVRGTSASATVITDARGRYTFRLPEGAHTIHVSAEGYTEVWRQVVVSAGRGVTPIDIRLAKRTESASVSANAQIESGIATLGIATISPGAALALTSVDHQSLAGLLPLGWSPLASAEIVTSGDTLAGDLEFAVPQGEIESAGATLSLVRYNETRDEWRVIVPAVNLSGDRATASITAPGSYALVYPDATPQPPLPSYAGGTLAGVDDPCAETPCLLTATSFTLDPPIVLPDGTSLATLTIDGASPFPSGTAVQAWIDEQLTLSDGSTVMDAPFATDLVLYRDLDGDPARARFQIAPSERAAAVILEVGWERIRVLPYPGRLARGALIGIEGGRVPSDGGVSIEIPPGAATFPIRAAAASLDASQIAALGEVAGFRILGGFSLDLERAAGAPAPDLDGDGAPDEIPLELLRSARATFPAVADGRVIVAELLDSEYGRIVRLAARTERTDPDAGATPLFTTLPIDRAILPLDGIVREGRYLFLEATTPIAFATGALRRGPDAPYLAGALVSAPPLAVRDLTRASGLFALPVPATTFTLTARHPLTGEGAPYVHPEAAGEGSIVSIGDFVLLPQPPRVVATTPSDGAIGVSLTTTVRIQFDRAMESASLTSDSVIVSEAPAGSRIAGIVTMDGAAAILWTATAPLTPATRYDVALSPTLRSATGAPLAESPSFSFTTLEVFTSPDINPARISITIPQNGVSTIRGTAGALPAGWQAVPTRRGTDFRTRYQATAATDGAFQFEAGNCEPAATASPLPGDTSLRSATAFRGEGSGVRGRRQGAGVGGQGTGKAIAKEGEERIQDDSELPRSLRVAEVHGFDREGVRGGERVPEGRGVRPVGSGETRSNVDPPQYRRGAHERVDERVLAASLDRAGITRGARDMSDPRREAALAERRSGERSSGALFRAGKNAVRIAQFSSRGSGPEARLRAQTSPAPRPLTPAPSSTSTGPGPEFLAPAHAFPAPRPLPPVPFSSICEDAIAITDQIDLHALDTTGTLKAIIPLTPYIGEDGNSFIALPRETTTLTTSDEITITVPAGAFAEPTLITTTTSSKAALDSVPDLDEELTWSASVRLDFDCAPCTASERIDIELPAPNADPAKIHLLGILGQSVRGPRIMIVDTLRVVDGRFTNQGTGVGGQGTGEQGSEVRGQGSGTSAKSATTLSTAVFPAPRPLPPVPFSQASPAPRPLPPVPFSQAAPDIKSTLLGVTQPGLYSVVDLNVPAGSSLGWSLISGLAGAHDLFWSAFGSLYASHTYVTAAKGTIAVPMLTGVPFTITGVDAATGLESFQQAYDPLPFGDPGEAFIVDSPLADLYGPWPVFASPFRVEVLDLEVEGVEIESIRNFRLKLEGGFVTVSDSAAPLDAGIRVTLLNASRGALDATRNDGLVVTAARGETIVLLIEQKNVDPDARLSIVCSEPLDLGGADDDDSVDAFLRTRLALHRIVGTVAEDVSSLVRFRADSGARRILIDSETSLERGASYRLRISKDLADRSGPEGGAGLKIGQRREGTEVKGGIAGDLSLNFTLREPAGEIASFDIEEGSIRDLARLANVVLVSALDGGLRAYDVADARNPEPLGFVTGIDDSWGLAVDHHNRIFATALGNAFGALRSYRLEQFKQPSTPTPLGTTIVSWTPGFSSGLGLASSTVLSDRPEAIPRKVQILSQDAPPGEGVPIEELGEFAGVTVGDLVELASGYDEATVTVAFDPGLAYLVQRITIENVGSGMRWSADARPGAPAVMQGVTALPGQRMRIIRNLRTYAAVSLFGYGIALFDLNAIESNDAESKPEGYARLTEEMLITRAGLEQQACSHPGPESGAIPDLTFTPESAILPHPSDASLRVYALDASRGVLDMRIDPAQVQLAGAGIFCGRAPLGMLFRSQGNAPPDDPRLHALRAAFEAAAGLPPFARFNSIAAMRWRGAAGPERDYLLVAGNDYGLLVVETPHAGFLAPKHLADIIWVPAGAASVRLVPGSNLAVVVDGEGHVLLVDLTRVDERLDGDGKPIDPAAIFPTAAASLAGKGSYGVGIADPRIVWRSPEPVASGTLAPLVDPATGLLYAGRLLGRTLTIVSALDPRLRIVVDIDGSGTLREVTGVVPLGILQAGGLPGAFSSYR